MQQPSSLPWPTQKRNFYPENLLCLPEKANFSHTKKKFLILYCKNFSHLSEKKKKVFSNTKIVSIITGKNNCPNKEFLILVRKNPLSKNFLNLCKKVRALHFRCVLNALTLLF